MKTTKNTPFICFCASSYLALAVVMGGCASSYQTPGAGFNVGNLSKADEDIGEILKLKPASPFPARLAVARIQASGYSSYGNSCYGAGQYCVVTTRDIETEDDLKKISQLPMIMDVALMSRILLPPKLDSAKDLRRAAASLKTDLLLVYSLDTQFNIDNTDIGPLALISLGFLPNKKAHVTSTATAAVFDVRTGFLYGVAEASAREQQRATFWSSEEAVENARLKAEAEAFKQLLVEVEKLWGNILNQYAGSRKTHRS